MDVCRREAIARRIPDIGMLSKGAGALSCTGLVCGCSSSNNAAASTSSRLTRPREPLLRQSCKLIPSLPAGRRASGVADTPAVIGMRAGRFAATNGGVGEAEATAGGNDRAFQIRNRDTIPAPAAADFFSGRHPSGQTVVTHGAWH